MPSSLRVCRHTLGSATAYMSSFLRVSTGLCLSRGRAAQVLHAARSLHAEQLRNQAFSCISSRFAHERIEESSRKMQNYCKIKDFLAFLSDLPTNVLKNPAGKCRIVETLIRISGEPLNRISGESLNRISGKRNNSIY